MMAANYFFLIWRFFKTLYDRFFEDACSYRAAALTYTTLLSLVPLMTVSFAIIAAFPVFQNLSQQIQDFIFSHFVAASGQVIQEYLVRFVSQTKNLSALGSFFLVVTAVLMMFNMEQSFNAIWRVESRRKGISTFMLYWAVLTLSPLLIGLSIVISSYITALPFISTAAKSTGMISFVPFILNLIFFMLIYVIVPNCYVPIRAGFIGALVASVLFTLAKFGFTYYVTHFPTYILLYGALATIPVFLIWLYVSWVIILFGAIISNVLATGHRFRSSKKMDPFTHAYRWLGHFWEALQKGRHLSLNDLLSFDSCDYQIEPARQIQLMTDAGFIQPSIPDNYVLSQDLSNLTLKDLLHRLPWRLPTIDEVSQWDGPWEKRLYDIAVRTEKSTRELEQPLSRLYKHVE